jgi:hypothetical protein
MSHVWRDCIFEENIVHISGKHRDMLYRRMLEDSERLFEQNEIDIDTFHMDAEGTQ